MAQHQGATFTNETVVLDGNEYRDCTFTNCELIFQGANGVALHGIAFNSCRWTFEGPAALTIEFMTALYRAGVTDMLDQTFENIRRGTHRQPDAPLETPPEG